MQLIINAGGTGTRLWPISTSHTPKQFTDIVGTKTLFRQTYERILPLLNNNNIWVSTNQKFLHFVLKDIPNFPLDRIILEPSKRDTFAAISSSAAIVAANSNDTETIVNIQSDAFLPAQDESKYLDGLRQIDVAIQSGQYKFTSIGVKPKFANTGLGYIETAEKPNSVDGGHIVKVLRFTEKPDQNTADQFVASGKYYWHWGTHSFSYRNLLEEIRTKSPESIVALDQLYSTKQMLEESFVNLPKIAFETVITEKIDSLGIVALDVDWDDIGTWETVAKALPMLDSIDQIELDGSNNKVKLENKEIKVAFVGVSNLVLVQTKDGIMVIDPKKANHVKAVSQQFDQ
jgi:mannose-1-phosphate guanylyltransferase